MSKGWDGSFLPALVTAGHLFVGLVPLSEALFGRCLPAQAPLTSLDLHYNSCFTFTASYKSLSGPPRKDSTAAGLTLVDLLNHGGRFQTNSFTHALFVLLKLEPPMSSLAPVNHFYSNFWFFFSSSFQWVDTSLGLFLLQIWIIGGWGFVRRAPLPSFHLKPSILSAQSLAPIFNFLILFVP